MPLGLFLRFTACCYKGMNMGIVRRCTFVLGILITVSVGLCGGAVSSKADAPGTIIVSDAKSLNHVNLYVADALGLFKKHGVAVTISETRDQSASLDAVVTGRADLFWSCPTVGISAIGNGAPLKIISQVKSPCSWVLVAGKKSHLTSWRDLKGKHIAGTSATCEGVIAYQKRAKNAGAEFVLETLAGGQALVALETGKIDGAILEEPYVSSAERKGFSLFFRDTASQVPCRVITARTGYLTENPEALKRFVAAIQEANSIILKDPRGTVVTEIAKRYTGIPDHTLKQVISRLHFTTTIQEQGLLSLADDLVALKNIRENPGKRLFAKEFRGITWGK